MPIDTEHFRYNAALNCIEVLASGLPDDYVVEYLSKGIYTPEEQLVPDWTQTSWLDKWSDVQSYVTRKKDAGAMPHAVMAYYPNLGADTPDANGFGGGILTPNGLVYMAPYTQADNAKWHYINTITGAVIPYAHGLGADAPVTGAYIGGGILAPNGRIYFSPYYQADQAKWHYINTLTGAAVAFAHGLAGDTPVFRGYFGGSLAPDGKYYLSPYAQCNQSKWHYINTSNNTVTAYAHGLAGDTPIENGYALSLLAPNGRIYLVPYAQANQSKWHYINTTTGLPVAYSHGLTGGDIPVAYAYRGAVLAPNGRIYLVPFAQANQSTWHYINYSDNTVVPYAHGLTGGDLPAANGYTNGILAPNGRIYLTPSAQSNQSKWHYIDTTTGSVVPYDNTSGLSAGSSYLGAVLAQDGRIYMIPYAQANQSAWHYIDTKPNSPWSVNLCTNPMFNKF